MKHTTMESTMILQTLSSGLNPIEGIRCILTHEVYKNGTCYDATKELKAALKKNSALCL